jgi:DNA-binding CsgD family transcriptional regulator
MPKKKVAKKKTKKMKKSILTDREQEVVRLVSLGLSVGETAKVLKLAPSTIDNHRTRAMVKMGVDKATLLTRMAIKLRITSLKDQLTLTEKRRSGRRNGAWNS